MARAAITRTAFAATGFNITDATFTTMATGANNGVNAPSQQGDIIILRNDTAGPATYTIKTPQPSGYTSQGITASDVTVVVVAAKIWVYEPTTLQRQADGNIYVDCDVAGKILLLAMN